MKKFLAIVVALGFLIPAQAFALDLGTAKMSGMVGEKADGLVGAITSNASPEILKLIEETNRGRMEVYKETAAKQGIPVSQVQAVAAQKLFNLTGRGQYIMTGDRWIKK